jgi:hypothetical protein
VRPRTAAPARPSYDAFRKPLPALHRRIPLEILLLAWDELDDWLAAGMQLLRRLS